MFSNRLMDRLLFSFGIVFFCYFFIFKLNLEEIFIGYGNKALVDEKKG